MSNALESVIANSEPRLGVFLSRRRPDDTKQKTPAPMIEWQFTRSIDGLKNLILNDEQRQRAI